MLFIFLTNHDFFSFQDFLHKHLLILFNYVLCYCKAVNINGNKWLLLDVNPKTRFVGIQKILKALKLKKKCFSNYFLFSSLVIKNIMWIVSGNGFFQNKVSLLNSISNQMLRVWSRAICANILLRRKLRRKKSPLKGQTTFCKNIKTEGFF